MNPFRPCVLYSTLVCLVVGQAASSAQSSAPQTPAAPPVAGQAAPSQAGGQQPPVVTFSPEGISLEEALNLSLQWDPNLQLQRSNVRFFDGVLQEQGGLFDTTFRLTTSYDFRRQELPESRKETEREKRTVLEERLAENAANRQRAQQLISAVQNVRNLVGSPQVDAIAELDPDIGTQLKIIDAVIAETTNADARQDLLESRDAYISRTLVNLEGGLGSLITQYDEAQRRLERLGVAPVDEAFYTGRLRVGLTKLFRSGISINPYFDTSAEGTNFVDKPRDPNFGGKGIEDLYTFRLGANLTLPLMRGRGGDAVAAGERAARIDRDVAELDARHQLSLTALQTALTYWDLRAAQHSAEIAAASVEKQGEIVKATQQLIAADELPQSEGARTEAAMARARARLSEAERRLVEARVALATVMGIAASAEASSLPVAGDPFPAAPAEGATAAAVPAGVTPGERRPDIVAAERNEEANRIIERAAVIDQRARLDLTGGLFYTALDERTVSNAVDRWVGPSTNISLNLEKPFGNNAARGRVVQSRAQVEQARVETTDLKRQNQLQIVRLTGSIEEAAERVRLAQSSVDSYTKLVEAELERFRIREATLIDTILTETQLFDARLQLVNAQRDLARLLAELRYETGTLIEDGKPATGLTTIPAIRR
jgi:outer membrane protein TolC